LQALIWNNNIKSIAFRLIQHNQPQRTFQSEARHKKQTDTKNFHLEKKCQTYLFDKQFGGLRAGLCQSDFELSERRQPGSMRVSSPQNVKLIYRTTSVARHVFA
jgi:hypothetical protein